MFDESTCITLQNSLKGNATSKLNIFGHLIHEEGRNRFGDKPVKRPSPTQRGRREKEIFQLVKERRLLRKSWRKAEPEEKEGLKDLWDKIKDRLAHLRRAERIKKRRSRREKARTCFFRQPFKFARSLLEESKTGKLQVTKQELEQHISDQLSDNLRAKPLGSPGYVPRPPEPSIEFDTSPPRWAEVKQVVERARSASAPGPNGVPYKVFKNCPGLLKALWRLMVAAWKTESIPSAWCQAVTTFIPKVKDSSVSSEASPC